LACSPLAARSDLRLLLLPFLLRVKILPFDPLRRVGGSLAFARGAVPGAVDGSFDDVRDGIFRMDVFFLGASAETALPCSEAICGWVTELSMSASLTVVASWTVSTHCSQHRPCRSDISDIAVVSNVCGLNAP
jgi:hypothetical protein